MTSYIESLTKHTHENIKEELSINVNNTRTSINNDKDIP